MFGAFLGIGQQFGFQRLVRLGRGAARAGAGQGADGDAAVLQPDQDLWTGAGQLEIDVVEEEEIGRRIAATQRTIEGEGVLAPRRREAVGQHDLEDVAGGDVVLGLGHHGVEAGGVDGRMEVGRRHRLGLALDRQRAAQAILEVVKARDGGGEGGGGGRAAVGIGRSDQDDLVLHGIEDGDQRRPRHDGVGQVQRVGVRRAQWLQQPHHVVAEDAEQARGHGRQVVGQVEPGGRDQGAQGVQRGSVFGGEAVGEDGLAARHFRLAVTAAPDDVGGQGDDRIAAVDRAAFDRLQQAGVGPSVTDLEEGRDGRL
ncbi:hypothetical protein D3C85_990510 [compost metagenome]